MGSIGGDWIPVNRPCLDGNEKRYLLECIELGWISSEGPMVAEFEARFAARVGRKHAIAVTNGSAALDVAVVALDLGHGDEVIIPSFTIISCAAAVIRAGATPVVVDCDHRTWTMDVEQVANYITPRTRAIMAVHIYGLPVDMGPLLELAARHGLKVIEDAAEAHGLVYCGRPCGGFGDVSTFSFYANKTVTTGEGGMIVTDEDALAVRFRALRNLCFQPERRFVHEELGWNLRMTSLQAAVGLAQLERLDGAVKRKRYIGRLYGEMLTGVNGLLLPVDTTAYADNIYWVYGVVLKEEVPFDAAEGMRRLAVRGIDTRPFFWPMHEQPVLRKLGLFVDGRCPVAERIARRGFYVPSGLMTTDTQIERVAGAIREILG